MNVFRIFYVCFSPFLKRIFHFEPILYSAISLSALLAFASVRVSASGAMLSLLISSYLLIIGRYEILALYFPVLFLITFKACFYRSSFDSISRRLVPFFVISIAYAVYQKIFGYLSFEMAWIRSGLGAVGNAGYFIREEIRPFSFLAGTPEFTVFVAMFSYYFFKNQKYLLLFISIASLGVAGSRGVIIATVIAYFLLFLVELLKSDRYKTFVFLAVVVNAIFYFMLTFIGPIILESGMGGNRLFVYGTFNARVETLLEFFNGYKDVSLLLPIFSERDVLDNIYLTFINHFGVLGLAVYIIIVSKVAHNKQSLFFVCILVGYGFYADVIFSFYMMGLIIFGIYARE